MDLAPSDLQRRLNPGDDLRPLTVDQMEQLLGVTDDFRPIYYLIEKFLQDPESKKQAALDQLAAIMPALVGLIEQAGMPTKKGK